MSNREMKVKKETYQGYALMIIGETYVEDMKRSTNWKNLERYFTWNTLRSNKP